MALKTAYIDIFNKHDELLLIILDLAVTKHPVNTIEFSRWLMAADPDQWYQVAQAWNWDNGTHRLQWIAEQPSCDLGTALLLFWLSEPWYNLSGLNPYRKTDRDARIRIDKETIELQITILKRWVSGSFTRAEIAFAGGQIGSKPSELAPIVPFEVLEAMAKPRAGKTVPRADLDEGIPHHIVAAFNQANGY
ncbi:MAG: DUF4274 domain-containing protein [Blastomonas fulva]|uniref:DUF4274 domain-containing protein n=1 Tax=Blastomonas fulva TaxID=1550728 RepID=UPI004034F59E